jgi:hypothetical protein
VTQNTIRDEIALTARGIKRHHNPQNDIPDEPEVTWVDMRLLHIIELQQKEITAIRERVRTDEIPNPPTERLCEVIWDDGETQYGAGHGDIYVIEGHYDIEPTDVLR